MEQTFREQSKMDWVNGSNSPTTTDQRKFGALQRIADAAEKMAASSEIMASNYNFLQNDRDRYKKWYQEEKESGKRMARRIASLQGVITKMKRRAAK